MRCAHATPLLGPGLPELGITIGVIDPRLHADGVRVASGGDRSLAHLGDGGCRLWIIGLELGEPAVGATPHSAEHAVSGDRPAGAAAGAHPQRDRPLHRQRVDAGVGYIVVAAVKIDDLFRPEPAQQFHLLLGATAAGGEVLAERFVLDGVPADANAQAQPPSAQHVHFGSLLGYQRGLALAKDDDGRDQLHAGGQGRHVAECHEDFVEHAVLGVAARPRLVVRSVRPQHVVVGDDVGVAQFLGRLHVIAHGDGVGTDFRLGENDPYLHLSVRHGYAPVNEGLVKTSAILSRAASAGQTDRHVRVGHCRQYRT